MTDQTEIFLKSEADAWFERNKASLDALSPDTDPAAQAVQALLGPQEWSDTQICEIGCASGYRLKWFKDRGATVRGAEPSAAAVAYGRDQLGLTAAEIVQADAAGYFLDKPAQADIIIFGHCLYLVEPKDIPQIVAGAIDALNEGGYIIIYDFDSVPQRQAYHHLNGLHSYKAAFDTYFTWFPLMRLVEKRVTNHDRSASDGNPKEDCALSIIRKVPVAHGFPELLGDIDV